jgi:hypothetical protein
VKRWRKPKTEPKESNLEEACRTFAHDRSWVTRKMNGFGFRSWPDRLFLPPERKKRMRFWVEFKRPGEESTPDQKRIQKTLRLRGEKVYEIDSKKEFISVFNRHNT